MKYKLLSSISYDDIKGWICRVKLFVGSVYASLPDYVEEMKQDLGLAVSI